MTVPKECEHQRFKYCSHQAQAREQERRETEEAVPVFRCVVVMRQRPVPEGMPFIANPCCDADRGNGYYCVTPDGGSYRPEPFFRSSHFFAPDRGCDVAKHEMQGP